MIQIGHNFILHTGLIPIACAYLAGYLLTCIFHVAPSDDPSPNTPNACKRYYFVVTMYTPVTLMLVNVYTMICTADRNINGPAVGIGVLALVVVVVLLTIIIILGVMIRKLHTRGKYLCPSDSTYVVTLHVLFFFLLLLFRLHCR